MKLRSCEEFVSNIEHYDKFKIKSKDIEDVMEAYFNQFVTHQMITTMLLGVDNFYHTINLNTLKKLIEKKCALPLAPKDEDIVQIVRDYMYVFGYYFVEESDSISSITVACDLVKHKNRIRFYDYIETKKNRPESMQYSPGDHESDYKSGMVIIINNDYYMILFNNNGWYVCADENWNQTQICSTDITRYDLVTKEGEVAYND